jgi:serine/threonine-protein kinase
VTDPAARLSAALSERYAIERELGQGGMATVYLAADVKHDRKVALKVLKPELAAVLGAERFVQEIKTTAQLQHPHILPLFDSGSAGGFLYYVMPYIQGETLRTKLDREHQLGVEEAVRLTREVADALDYAHRHGVIHRDIKPENILLHDGRPMVADFGIALALSAAAGGRMTETGLSLGTPHYMSPEQATAEKEITARSDVYSLASVLYEMLTGNPPHTGSSAQQIIMRIIAEDVQPVTALRKSVPANITAAVAQALEKLPADRFDTAKAFADALADPGFTGAMQSVTSTRPGVRSSTPVPIVAAIMVALTALAAWGWLRPTGDEPTPVWYEMALPEPLSPSTNVPQMALSPDGDRLVYAGLGPSGVGTQLFLRSRGSLHAEPLPNTEGANTPEFSPDGRRIAFLAGVPPRLRTQSLAGGSGTTLLDLTSLSTRGIGWGDDGFIYLGDRDGLARVPEAGGDLEELRVAGADRPLGEANWPEPIPGSPWVLFQAARDGASRIWAHHTGTGEQHTVVEGTFARFLPPDRLLVVTPGASLLAGRFDVGSATVGDMIPVADGVRVNPAGYADLEASHDGRLVYIGGSAVGDEVDEAVWMDREGRMTPVDSNWRFASSGNSGWALSPDGDRLAIKLNSGGQQDIWVRDLRNRTLQRVSFEPTDDIRPRWTPDGRGITYVAGPLSLDLDAYERRADGTGGPALLADLESTIYEAVRSPDGEWLVLRVGGSTVVSTGRDIWIKHADPDSVPRPLLDSPADERAVALSPDGRWIAYQSDASGQNEVYVRPFPDVTAGQWQISVGGGSAPLWARDGRELYYVNPALDLVAVDLTRGPTRAGARKTLFSMLGLRLSTNYTWFDIHPDGRFLMVRESLSEGRLIVVEHSRAYLRAAEAR